MTQATTKTEISVDPERAVEELLRSHLPALYAGEQRWRRRHGLELDPARLKAVITQSENARQSLTGFVAGTGAILGIAAQVDHTEIPPSALCDVGFGLRAVAQAIDALSAIESDARYELDGGLGEELRARIREVPATQG